MREPSSHKANSPQSQSKPSIEQRNTGSMGGGQQAAQGDGNVQVQGNNNKVWNFFFGSRSKLIPQQEYRNRKILLTKVKNFWVKGVLEKSLYNQVLIELGLEERPDAIANPWSMILDTGDNSPQPLSSGTKVIDIFDEIGPGRTLLILGEPGAGKTTTLLELTRDLIIRAEQNINLLIPVVFNLSSWANKRQKIADWLIEELNIKYDVSKKIAQALVTQQKLLPLLDGLDEIKREYRNNCIVALNEFKKDCGAELVVCSRIKDYEVLSERLNFQSAVYIRLLNLEQIYHYLNTLGDDLRGLKTLIAEDKVLKELVNSPLMLNIMTLTYQGVAVENLPKTEIIEERRKQLFDDYIEKMFHRIGRWKGIQTYSEPQVKYWLTWLARRMLRESQTVFLIERINLTSLRNKYQKYTYAILHGLTIGLIMSLTLIASGSGLVNGLIAVTLISILTGFTWGIYTPKLETTESLRWSWKNIDKLTPNFIGGVIICSLIGGYFLGLKQGLIFGFVVMVITLAILGFAGDKIIETTKVNQGIWQSFRNGTVFTSIGVLGMGIFAFLVNLPIINAAIFGLNFGLFRGFPACIQHFIVRLILYRNNYIPWNYARFLDYATDRIFLQKVGGGYIFIHRMLMEHFAQMTDK